MQESIETQRQRLDRLEGWLRADPRNTTLLADACDTALAAGEEERAQALLEHARDIGAAGADWRFRRARLALVRRQWSEAIERLRAIQAEVGAQPALSHDIAFAHLQLGQPAECRAAVAPWCGGDAGGAPEAVAACHVLWLRASHALGLVDEAWDWIGRQLARGALPPAAAGVASLVAVDHGDFAQARDLADAALRTQAPAPEACVARASVALADHDPALATRLLRGVLELHPRDGRTWSTLGMATLLSGDAAQARVQFQRAVESMPLHVGTWHGLGWACVLLQDGPGALAAFRRALELDPAFGESHGAVGLALVLTGRADEARQHLDVADRLDRRNATARYTRALVTGQLRDASSVRELALRLLDRPGLFGGKLHDSLGAPAAEGAGPPPAPGA